MPHPASHLHMDPKPSESDPLQVSSRTARRIHALGEVDTDITRLLSLAASAISLLTLTQTDEPGSNLPQGEERSEQFVLEVSEYFERLHQVHLNMRSALAYMRQSRIAPSAIMAPPPSFVPQLAGANLPSSSSTDGKSDPQVRGLQEERVNREAWKAFLDALKKLKAAREQSQMNVDSRS